MNFENLEFWKKAAGGWQGEGGRDGLKETKDTQVPLQDLRFSTWELRGENVSTPGDFTGNTKSYWETDRFVSWEKLEINSLTTD